MANGSGVSRGDRNRNARCLGGGRAQAARPCVPTVCRNIARNASDQHLRRDHGNR
jgi:hypothetical protein